MARKDRLNAKITYFNMLIGFTFSAIAGLITFLVSDARSGIVDKITVSSFVGAGVFIVFLTWLILTRQEAEDELEDVDL